MDNYNTLRAYVLRERDKRNGLVPGVYTDIRPHINTIRAYDLITEKERMALTELLRNPITRELVVRKTICKTVQRWSLERMTDNRFSCTCGTRHEYDEENVFRNLHSAEDETELELYEEVLQFGGAWCSLVSFLIYPDTRHGQTGLRVQRFYYEDEDALYHWDERPLFYPTLAEFFYEWEINDNFVSGRMAF